MIIKLIESKTTARKAKGYAAVLIDYIGLADLSRHRQLAAFEQERPIDHGLSVVHYMAEEEAGLAKIPAPAPVRVQARGAMTNGAILDWEAALIDMRRRLDRNLAPGAKPVRHAVASLRSNERIPSDAQCEDMGQTLLDELNCPEALLFWALHTDTGNYHVHFMIITVDPTTASTTNFGNRAGYKDAMQRAIARLEDEHGFERETGARYGVVDGKLRLTDSPKPDVKRGPPIDNQILTWERESGVASFTRMAQERAAPVLRDATSWDEVHKNLAVCGMALRRRTGGGEIVAGDEHVKLSRVGRDVTWKKLTALDNLGPYIAAPADLELAQYLPRIDDPVRFSQWSARRERNDAVAAAARDRIQNLHAQRSAAIARIRAESAALIENLGSGGPAYLRQDIRARIRAVRDADIATVRGAFDFRIQAIRANRDQAADLPAEASFDLADFSASDMVVTGPSLASERIPEPLLLIGYDARRRGNTIEYHAINSDTPHPAFIDHGALIFVNSNDAKTVSTVLSVAAARFGTVAVAGTPEFIAECRIAARRLGIPIEVTDRKTLLGDKRQRTDVGWKRLLVPQKIQPEQDTALPQTKTTSDIESSTAEHKLHYERHRAMKRAAKTRPTPRR